MKQTDDILIRFGQRIRELRKKRGFSQEAFAAACGMDRTYMGGIERGGRNVALGNIGRIGGTLGLTVAQPIKGV